MPESCPLSPVRGGEGEGEGPALQIENWELQIENWELPYTGDDSWSAI